MPDAQAQIESLSAEQRGTRLLESLFTESHALLEELYQRREILPASDFFVAAALGDVAAVEMMLAADRSLASRVGGPLRTQAITYVAHARFFLFDNTYGERQQRIASLLLAHGADPSSFARDPAAQSESGGRWSALYGCCRHPGNPAVAKLLLDAGATTDDGESLYHASELQDTRCLELLFAAGVPVKSREFCIRRALDDENPKAIEVYLANGTDPNHLDWALFRQRSLAIVKLLVERGADVNRTSEPYWLLERIQGLAPIQIAERGGRTDVVAYLLVNGATDVRTPSDRLIGACTRGDRKAVEQIVREHPSVIASLTPRDHSNISTLARMGELRAVELMLEAGFDIEARADDLDATALHYAASNGDVAMVKLLLSHDARTNVKHKYGGTPLGTALYSAAHSPTGGGDYTQTATLLLQAGEEATSDRLAFAIENDLDVIAEVLKAHGATL